MNIHVAHLKGKMSPQYFTRVLLLHRVFVPLHLTSFYISICFTATTFKFSTYFAETDWLWSFLAEVVLFVYNIYSVRNIIKSTNNNFMALISQTSSSEVFDNTQTAVDLASNIQPTVDTFDTADDPTGHHEYAVE